jgi:hypothetical protein
VWRLQLHFLGRDLGANFCDRSDDHASLGVGLDDARVLLDLLQREFCFGKIVALLRQLLLEECPALRCCSEGQGLIECPQGVNPGIGDVGSAFWVAIADLNGDHGLFFGIDVVSLFEYLASVPVALDVVDLAQVKLVYKGILDRPALEPSHKDVGWVLQE